MNTKLPLIIPDWPAPSNIKAFTTTRSGGISRPPYDGLNLADHVGDDINHVYHNRQQLIELAQLPAAPLWLKQTHGTEVIDSQQWQANYEADAIYSDQINTVCSILTADCLPVLLCDEQGQHVAAIHAGWRGLLNGIIEKTVHKLAVHPQTILAWLGPAIGPQKFEVGTEVFEAFVDQNETATNAFQQTDATHYLADIYQLARLRLNQTGVTHIYGGHHCTVSEPNTFFSYRREHETGRMASIIWITDK